MAQEYLSVEEAAQRLGVSIDEMKRMAQKGEIRRILSEGTFKFRPEDVEDKARDMTLGGLESTNFPDFGGDGVGAPAPFDWSPEVFGDAPAAPEPKPAPPVADKDDLIFADLEDTGELPTMPIPAPLPEMMAPPIVSDEDDPLADFADDLGGTPPAGADMLETTMPTDFDWGAPIPVDDSGEGSIHGDSPVGGSVLDDEQVVLDESALTGLGLGKVDPGEQTMVGGPLKGSLKDDSESDVRLTSKGSLLSDEGSSADSGVRLDFGDVDLGDNFGLDLDDVPTTKFKRGDVGDFGGKADGTKLIDQGSFDLGMESSAFGLQDDNDFRLADEDLGSPQVTKKLPTPPLGRGGLNDATIEFATDDDAIDLTDIGSSIMRSGPDSGINLGKPSDSGILLSGRDDSSTDSEFELSLDSVDEADFLDSDDDVPAFADSDDDIAVGPIDSSGETETIDSDFELAIDQDDDDGIEVDDEESGSEVVAIDEEEDDFEGVADEFEEYDDAVPAAGLAAAGAGAVMLAPVEASWPGWIIAPLSLTSIMLVMCGMVMFEAMRNAWSFNTQAFPLTETVSKTLDENLVKPIFGG